MKHESRALAVALLAVLVVVTIGGALVYLDVLGTALPVPAGTVFAGSAIQTWSLHFNVSGSGSGLVGAWTAYHGLGYPALVIVAGTVGRPDLPGHCPILPRWAEYNGSIDAWVPPGPHTVFWGICFGASEIVVTQPIRLA